MVEDIWTDFLEDVRPSRVLVRRGGLARVVAGWNIVLLKKEEKNGREGEWEGRENKIELFLVASKRVGEREM